MATVPALAVVHPATPDEKFQYYLDNLDDDLLACKAGVHSIPKIKPGDLPKGTQVRRARGGVFQVTLRCRDCDLPVTATTEKGGVLGSSIKWEYDYKELPGYLAPKGTGRGRKPEYKDELGRRVAPTIRQAGAATASAEAAAKRTAAAARAATKPRTAKPRGNAHATNPRARSHTRQGEAAMHHEWEQRGGSA